MKPVWIRALADVQRRRQAAYMHRLSETWAGAVFAILAEGSIGGPLAVATLLYPLAAFVAIESPDGAQNVMMLNGVILGLGFARGAFIGVREPVLSALLFQRPVSPDEHLLRAIGLRIALLTIVELLGGGLLLLSTVLTGIDTRMIAAMVAGAWVWSAVLFCVTVGIGSLVGRQETELMIVLIVLSFGQGVVLNSFGFQGVIRDALSLAFLPIDGIFLLWEGMLNRMVDIPTLDFVHLLVYPIIWLCVGIASARRMRSTEFAR